MGKRYGNFDGSLYNGMTGDWMAQLQSGTDEIRWDIVSLRRRAREQERNNPHVARFLKLLQKNVVGSDGIQLIVDAMNTRGAPHIGVNKKIQLAFEDWGKSATCTVNRSLGWTGFLTMVIRTWARDGECFVRMIPADNLYGFSLQLLDADLLDENYRVAPSATQNEINMGIEVDPYGAPIAYHFWTRHPTESWGIRQRIRVPAAQIIHVQQPRRYGALRAETILAPVLMSLRQTAKFIEAATVNARTGASKMGFIQKDPDAAVEDDEQAPREMRMEAQAGVIEELEIGETFVPWNPAFPSESFGPFTNAMLQYISVGLDIPAIELTGDLTQTSYASSRIGKLDGQDTYRQLQKWLIEVVCQPIYEAWLDQAMLTGALELPGSDVTRWHNVKWRPRGWQGVDPLKEVTASKMAVDFQFSSRQRECARLGIDFFEVLEELKAEQNAMRAAGITDMHLSTVIIEGTNGNSPKQAVASGAADPDDGSDDSGTDDSGSDDDTGSTVAGQARDEASRRLPGRRGPRLLIQASGGR